MKTILELNGNRFELKEWESSTEKISCEECALWKYDICHSPFCMCVALIDIAGINDGYFVKEEI